MTEEIIIDECFNCKKKKDIGDNWRTCKLKCSYKYKRKENDYITRLEQENKELKKACEKCKLFDIEKTNRDLLEQIEKLEQENADSNEYCLQELEKKYEQLRSALEEIRENLVKLKTNDEDDFTYEYSKIEDKINEVLNESK